MTKLSDEAREKAARKKAGGNILYSKERAKLKERAQNTPHLDKILKKVKD